MNIPDSSTMNRKDQREWMKRECAQYLDKFIKVLMKLDQANRIRDKIKTRRTAVLAQVGRNFDALKSNQGLLQTLQRLYNQELRFMRVILKKEKQGRGYLAQVQRKVSGPKNALSRAIDILKEHKGIAKSLFEGKVVAGVNITAQELNHEIQNEIRLLRKMQRHMEFLKDRMNKENHFLINPNLQHFSEFLQAWDTELREEEKMFVELRKYHPRRAIVKQKLFQKIAQSGGLGIGSAAFIAILVGSYGFLAGPDAGYSSQELLKIMGNTLAYSSVIMTAFFLIGFTKETYDSIKKELPFEIHLRA
ncbi:MAG: hypothetical protein ABIH34_02150 [Nanoarchaeota archaeon]